MLVNEFYDYCSFDEACDFYKRYTGSNIKINKTAQTISVPGYDVRKNNFIENYITMDWKNKLYIYKIKMGKILFLMENKSYKLGFIPDL